MHFILQQYDQRPLVFRAILIGLFVLITGLCLDDLFHTLRLNWWWERLLENLFEAGIMGFVAYWIVRSREIRFRKRFKELGYLNHHIRNALCVIEMCMGFTMSQTDREVLVRAAAARILKCLEKVSREEDLTGIEQHPQEP